jgi:hypothetical protein
MFIIYNTFAIAVAQRRSEIGILRALGAIARADQELVSSRERDRWADSSWLGIGPGIVIAREWPATSAIFWRD